MEDKKNIYQTINAVMADVGAIGKGKTNSQQGFNYRGIDDVLNALQPAFIKNRLCCVPEILEQTREERQTARGGNLIYSVCKIKYHFIAEDGSQVEAVVIGEGMDSGDKSTNKAMSVAFKYACFQVFCIPTEEMQDPDAEIPPQSTRKEADHLVGEAHIAAIKKEMDRTRINTKTICYTFGLRRLEDMNMKQFRKCMEEFKKTPDYIPPAPVPDEADPNLPFA